MRNFKFITISIIAVLVLALLLVWALSGLQSGTEHRTGEIISSLEKENEELQEKITILERELDLLKPVETEEPVIEEPTITTPETYKYQTLINDIEKLISDNVQMKLKSRGTRVGTVQEFLNLYNGTSKKIDNDYGQGTKTDVANFQKAEGLTADGEAGPATYRKMIEWLKKQG